MFHYVTRRVDTKAVIDDSVELGLGPFELRSGKSFVLQCWEKALRTMTVGTRATFVFSPQVSHFHVDQTIYQFVESRLVDLISCIALCHPPSHSLYYCSLVFVSLFSFTFPFACSEMNESVSSTPWYYSSLFISII